MNGIEEIWNVELLILKEVDRICKKYSIQYYAEGGTLLGAVRHKGFIPWDDDIDLAMFRKDFKKFKKVAKTELGESFFCQSGDNDKGFYGGMLHIRMKDTTAILLKNFPHVKFNQGIFIDVFPLDGIIENRLVFALQTFFKKVCNAVMWYKNSKSYIKPKFKHILLFFPALLPQKILFWLFEHICGWGKADSSKYVDLVSYFGITGKRLRSSYADVSYVEFEDTKIPIPKNYDEVLTSIYGSDYMSPKHSSSDHGEVFFDIKHSYKDYLSGKLKIPEEFFVQCQNQ